MSVDVSSGLCFEVLRASSSDALRMTASHLDAEVVW
jgi:hypothetical protein